MEKKHFLFNNDQLDMAEHMSRFLNSEVTMEGVRGVLEGAKGYQEDVWQKMAEQGWLGLSVAQTFGGAGQDFDDLCLLAREVGKSMAVLPFVSHICLATEALSRHGDERVKARYLADLVSGRQLATFGYREPGQREWRAVQQMRCENNTLTGTKAAVPFGQHADLAVISASAADGGVALYAVDLSAPGITVIPAQTIDPASPYASIEFDRVLATPLDSTALSQHQFEQLIFRAAIVDAFIQQGSGEAVFNVARRYALERYAFGRPIGSFQAIKHKIGRMFEQQAIAEANCSFGAWAMKENSSLLGLAAACAHLSSSDAFSHCARENIRIHGGISATWEHDCHLYYRRAKVAAVAMDSRFAWNRLLAEQLIANQSRLTFDFSALDEKQENQSLRQEIREWIQNHRPSLEHLENLSEDDKFDVVLGWHKAKAKAGWACPQWPTEYGGKGWGPEKVAIWQDEEGESMRDLTFGLSIMDIAGPVLLSCASEEQKQRYLPKMQSGEEFWCMLFSEPHAGSDVGALRTRAVKDGDDWIISGQKVWTSNAHHSDMGLLIARTDPSVPKHKGLTYFLVDMHSPGIDIRPLKQITGNSEFCEVFFDNVRIPDANRLGPVGGAWRIIMSSLANEKVALRTFQIHLQRLLSVISDVSIDGQPAWQNALVQDKLKQYALKSMAVKFIELQSMHRLLNKQQPGHEEAVTKLIVAATNLDLASFAMDIYNEHCFDGANSKAEALKFFEYLFLHFVGVSMGGGTEEILLNLIGEALGLPAEPRVDKDIPFNQLPVGA
jgi:alkylation response protein AidB-like acyl-CoA dehydrogenase